MGRRRAAAREWDISNDIEGASAVPPRGETLPRWRRVLSLLLVMFMQNSEETFLRWRGALVTAVDVVCTGGGAQEWRCSIYICIWSARKFESNIRNAGEILNWRVTNNYRRLFLPLLLPPRRFSDSFVSRGILVRLLTAEISRENKEKNASAINAIDTLPMR